MKLIPETDFYTPGTAGVALGGAYWAQGKIVEAEQAFQTCANIALKGNYVSRASSALCYMGMQQIFQARLKQAETTFRKSLALGKGENDQFYPVAGYPLAKLGELACEWNQLDKALAYAEEGLKQCKLLGHVDLIAEAYAALARVQLALADYDNLQKTLEQADQLAAETKLDPWAITWLDECRIRLWLATGKLEQATLWVNRSGIDIHGPFSFHYDLNHLILVRVMIANIVKNKPLTHPDQCLQLIERLLVAINQNGWIHHKIQTLILKSLALQAINDLDGALKSLAQAITLAKPSNYVQTFIREGEIIEKLLHPLHSRKKSDEYIQFLLKAFTKKGTSPRSELIEPLSPRETEILGFLTTSLSVPEIANELTISSNTVRSHIKSIYGKLEVNRRLDAIEKAKELHLV
jgi:LuxR family maltose regulon positive regulatory protein